MFEAPKILLVRFSSMGDIILTTPLVRALKSKFPESSITYVTKRAYAPLLEENPFISRLVALEPGETVRSLADRIGPSPFDYSLDLHSSLRSIALRFLLGGTWSSYRKRRWRRSALVHLGIDFFTDAVPVAERYFHAASGLKVVPDGEPPEIKVSENAMREAHALVTTETVLLAPGARHATKRWPGRHWHDLSETLRARGTKVFAIGQPHERSFIGSDAIPGAFNAGLDLAAAITRVSRMVVTNDSGFMHLGTAVGTPVIAMFGPTVRQFGFFPYSVDATVVERDLGCRPCSSSGSRGCPLGHHDCLEGIPAAEIASLVEAA